MKLKRDFILYCNSNKPPPKEKTFDKENILKKIPAQTLEENPQIRKAFQFDKKIYLNRIKRGLKPEHIKIDKQMSDSDIKMYTKINYIQDVVYDLDKDDDNKELEDIAEENEQFSKNYKKLKKEKNKFNRGNYLDFPAFLDISSKYVKKNMKVPNLSEEHNLFSANPLILAGSELENYIVYNLGDKTKGVKFLERLDDYMEKKITGNTKMNIKEMERIEKLKREEKPKGYIPPEVEISKLKDDISNCESSFKNIVDLEEFFKPKKSIFKGFTLKKNNSSINMFNNNIEKNPKRNFKRKITPNFQSENTHQNNSLVTATTSIGITRKSSPKLSNKSNALNFNNIRLNLSKDYQFKLPKLDTPIRSPSSFLNDSNYQSNKVLKIKKIHFNNNQKLKIDTKYISRNNYSFSPIFNSNQNNAHEFNNRFNKLGNKNKMYKLLKISRQQSNNDISKKENPYISTETEEEEIMELNKETENNKEIKEIKEKTEKEETNENIDIKNKEINNEENNENEEEEKDENNKKYIKIRLSACLNKKESKIEKIRKLNRENSKINANLRKKSNSIINLKMPQIQFNKFNNNKEIKNKSLDVIKNDPNEERFNKLENLFNITKEDKINNLKSETKNDIESYLSLKGKSLNKLLTTKSSYYSIQNLMRKSKERNIILEEYMIRSRFNAKEPLTTKQKLILDKNNSFVKDIIKQGAKFNEIVYKGETNQE